MPIVRELTNLINFDVDMSGMNRAERRINRFRGQAHRGAGGVGNLTSKLGQFAAGGAAVAALGQLSMAIGRTNVQFERQVAALETVTGSAEKAQEVLKRLYDFAAETPFDQAQVVDAFTKLEAMGLDSSNEALRSLGNTASAMGKTLTDAIEAVADASTGEFERLKEFGIKARTQGDQVELRFRGMTTTIGKNAEEIQEYLLNIGKTDFAGGMERQSQTLGGKISNLKDILQQAAITFFQAGGSEQGKDILSQITEAIGDAQPAIETLGKVFALQVKRIVQQLTFAGNVIKLVWQNVELFIDVWVGLAEEFYGVELAAGDTGSALEALGSVWEWLARQMLLPLRSLRMFLDDFQVWQDGGASILGQFLGDYETFMSTVREITQRTVGPLDELFRGFNDAMDRAETLGRKMGIVSEPSAEGAGGTRKTSFGERMNNLGGIGLGGQGADTIVERVVSNAGPLAFGARAVGAAFGMGQTQTTTNNNTTVNQNIEITARDAEETRTALEREQQRALQKAEGGEQ